MDTESTFVMPVSVSCPQCGKELVAPDELIGKVASCPQCNTPFPVAGGNGQSAAGVAPKPAPAAANYMPPPASAAPTSPPAEATQPLPQPTVPAPTELPPKESYLPPGKDQPPSKDQPPAESKPAKFKTRPDKADATGATPAGDSVPDAAPTAKDSAAATASPQRAAEPARFIAAAQATETAIQLGQDGQLPTLVLEEGKSQEQAKEDGQQSNPLLLVAVLCFSLLSSLVMLFFEFEAGRPPDEQKRDARAAIQQFYIQGQPLLEEYQHELRRALQAHNKGDYATERRHYHSVVRMLQAENNDDLKGLTGQARADRPPNDEHLREQLSTLLRKD